MAATYRTSWAGGGSTGTSNRTLALTPAVGDLLVAFVAVSANTNDAPTMTDTGTGGTWSLIVSGKWSGTGTDADRHSVFIRNALAAAASSITITATTGSNTAGEIVVVAVSGMTRVGSYAALQSITGQGAASVAPAVTFGSNCNTANMTLFGVASADTTTTAPSGWTERQDASQSSPTTALEVATRDSGFATATITAGATQASAWGASGIELDPSLMPATGSFTGTAPVAALSGAGAVSLAATATPTAPVAALSSGAAVALAGSAGPTAPVGTLVSAALVDLAALFAETAPVGTLSSTAHVTDAPVGGTHKRFWFRMRTRGGRRR